ncbi:hypothetical protein GQ54DRAFT_257449 [Martensiomyces pterosporus]|nr:hypothetical protein GQ54DRAFT_257449 [Martensiomyces pterosporus]
MVAHRESPGALRTVTLVVYIVSSAISLLSFLYGLLIIYLKPAIWKNCIFKILVVVQIINCLRFIFRASLTLVKVHSAFGCRVLLFLNNVTAVLPVYLGVYCVLYLQLLVIHRVPLEKRWPRIVLLTTGVVFSVVPSIPGLFISRRNLEVKDFCSSWHIPGNKLYKLITLTYSIWVYGAGLVGLASVLVTTIYIFRTSKATKSVLLPTERAYGIGDITECGIGRTALLQKLLRSIVWFPLMPIVSLWFNTILFSIHHFTQQAPIWMDYVNVSLLALESVVMFIALVVNPSGVYVVRSRFHQTRLRSSTLTKPEHCSSQISQLYQASSAELTGTTDSEPDLSDT